MIDEMLYELPYLNYWEFFLQLCGRRKKLRIIGFSMQPTLNPGEEFLMNPRAYLKRSPQVNDIVVIFHPQQPSLRIIKRIAKIEKGDRYFLLGDNLQHSDDSRSFGLIERKQIIGKLTTRANFLNE